MGFNDEKNLDLKHDFKMERRQLLLFLLILGTAFWGVSYSVTKMAIGHYSLNIFLFYRFLLAVMVLSIVFWKYVKDINREAIKNGPAGKSASLPNNIPDKDLDPSR